MIFSPVLFQHLQISAIKTAASKEGFEADDLEEALTRLHTMADEYLAE